MAPRTQKSPNLAPITPTPTTTLSAVISFVISGDTDAAAYTLEALARLIRADGSLWFNYSTSDNWPDESDHDSAMVRAGAIGWAGYAFAFLPGECAALRAVKTPVASANEHFSKRPPCASQPI